jgi:hypothetical protein
MDGSMKTVRQLEAVVESFVSMAQQPSSGPGPPHYRCFTITLRHTPQSVGLLWTRDRPVAETSTWQHTIPVRDKHPCPRRDSNPQSQQASSSKRTRGHWDLRLRAIRRNVQGSEGGKTAPVTMFLQRNEKHFKILKHCFGGGGGAAYYSQIFSFLRGGGVLVPNPKEKRDMCVFYSFPLFCYRSRPVYRPVPFKSSTEIYRLQGERFRCPRLWAHIGISRVTVGCSYIHNSMQLSRNSDSAQPFKLNCSVLSLRFFHI